MDYMTPAQVNAASRRAWREYHAAVAAGELTDREALIRRNTIRKAFKRALQGDFSGYIRD